MLTPSSRWFVLPVVLAVAACGGNGGGAGAGGKTSGAGGSASSASTGGASTSASGSSSSGSPGPDDVVVDASDVHQTMDGFGAADVWMGALTTAQADLFFSPTSGIGLSILRVGIDSTGENLAPWANAQMAAARGAIVWAAPWTPPAADKDNNDVNNGGHLLAADYDAWATTLAAFAAKMQQNASVQLYGISAQNEPDFSAGYPSCIYSGAQMAAFAKVLGPKLSALSPPVKLLAAEPDLWADLWGSANAYGSTILGDAAAAASVDVLATHQYGEGAVTAPPAGVGKPIWETEASGVMGSSQAGPSADIGNGIAVAQWIHDAIATGGASAWHYWWLISLNDDNEGLLLVGGGTTKRLYTMGNFSKFVRPGYRRVGTSGPVPAGVKLTAYEDPNGGHLVVVAVNTNGAATALPVFVKAAAPPSQVTPWVTSASDDLAAQAAIPVAGARVSVMLPAQSVTTLVGTP